MTFYLPALLIHSFKNPKECVLHARHAQREEKARMLQLLCKCQGNRRPYASNALLPPSQVGSEALDSPSKARSLRRTVSVPSDGQFPEFPAESTAVLGKLLEKDIYFLVCTAPIWGRT